MENYLFLFLPFRGKIAALLETDMLFYKDLFCLQAYLGYLCPLAGITHTMMVYTSYVPMAK